MVRSRPEFSVIGVRQVLEVRDADAAHVLHHLRGVAGVVPLEDLEHRPRVLQGLVALHPGVLQGRTAAAVLVRRGTVRRIGAVLCASPGIVDVASALLRVRPCRRVVLSGLRIEAGEQPAQILGVPVIVVDQRGGVGVGDSRTP